MTGTRATVTASRSRSATWRPPCRQARDATVAAGATLSRPGSFSDPGSLDSWTATVDYGDGSDPQPLLLPASITASSSSTPTPARASYTLTVTVSDDDGGAGSDTVTVTVEAPLSSADLSIANRTHPTRRSSAAPSSIR